MGEVAPVRLIFSRKGFDSASGGCPSPILPDGSMLSLPIPDKRSPVRYRDLIWKGRDVGELVEQLTRGRQRGDYRAHVDPDLRPDLRRRAAGWRPALGQRGPAQGHLSNQGVCAGDLFLFWGLFRRVDVGLRWVGPKLHVLWGWLQVGSVGAVDAVVRPRVAREWSWAADHPHLSPGSDPTNTLYVAADGLRLGGRTTRAPAAGVFDALEEPLTLTAADASTPSIWRLPSWFLPGRRAPLTYHDSAARWTRGRDHVRLRAAARGQEFVLDADDYPEAADWALGLIRRAE